MKKILITGLLVALVASMGYASPVASANGADGIEWGDGAWEPTAVDYIQDGLVCMWDAIENLGYGETDLDSRIWYDVVNGIEMPLIGCASFLPTGGMMIEVPEGYSGQTWMRPVYSQVLNCLSTSFGGHPSGMYDFECTTEILAEALEQKANTQGFLVGFGTCGAGGGAFILTRLD